MWRVPRPHLYSCSYRKCPQGGSTFSFPPEIPRSTRALDTVVFQGCRFFWNVPHLGAHCFFPLRFHSLPRQIQSPAKTSRHGVLSYLGGGTLRKTVASGNCSTGSRGGQATFQGPSSSQGTRRGWAAGGPPGGPTWRLGCHAQETRHPRSKWGSFADASPSPLLSTTLQP